MREILFRGQRTDAKEWVEGYYICDHQAFGIDDFHTHICNNPHPSGCFGNDIYKEVIPETVGQFTGLTDKNGTKIFEGDILHITISDQTGKLIAEANETVEFKDCKFGISWGHRREFLTFDNFCHTTFEVIGNIHDSPELLGGGIK